jgi:NADPH-dependent 2,4-dienoyl-CoA reductase/sulfur reductase-like enzyme
MIEIDVLVIGGGCAGVAAACSIAESGRSVMLCDQSPSLGGAIHRKVAENCKTLPVPGDHVTSWRNLKARLAQQSDNVKVRTGSIFTGLDSTGIAVIKDHISDISEYIAPKAMVFATGAYESIRPIPGWHHYGVMTAGALQIQMKSAGEPPVGKILLAGSGPLLLAIAAQLTSLGNAPVAVIESARPLAINRHWPGLPIPYLREGVRYVMKLLTHHVPWVCGSDVEQIERSTKGLTVTVANARRRSTYEVDIVALHNGLQANNVGLPISNLDPANGMLIVHAGDCHAVLGARAAPLSGDLAASKLLAAMGDSKTSPPQSTDLAPHIRAQAKLAKIFSPVRSQTLEALPDKTILCRCEQMTVGDLRQMLLTKEISAREIKLNGRFGMGRCQGRYCAKWVLELLGDPNHDQQQLTGRRWPVRPVSIRSLAGLGDQEVARSSKSNKPPILRETE